MKPVSDKFKESIKKYGRQIDAIITYTDKEGEHLLDSDVLFSITPTVNGNILKSVMKQLEFESSVKVPKGAIIKAQLGVQIDLSLTVAEINAMLVERLKSTSVNLLSAGLKGFEYITFGNYIVSEEPEYNADTLSYYHKCYDKLLYSMKEYEKLSVTYPISIRDYLKKICSHLGLTFKNANDIFANYNKQIKTDLYDGYDYTFRDILDELAQVTASTICINENTDELEIRYLNNTQDCINEDYLKDVNVEFGKVYGPINSIVLSRAGESDNVYLPNEESIQENGLCELKIIDNQIMNDNDRSDYLPDILAKLNGVSYCINDFSSYGITWYELCDMYTVEIGTKKYNCVLFNDEIKITQGLEETIYTEMPVVSETDYTKADKTDRRINKAYIIVDKQNQKIELLVSQQSETGEKLSKVEQTVDGITQSVSEVEEKVEIVEEKADVAQEKADQVNNNLATKYYTKTETNSQIEQKSEEITSTVSKTYSTKTETSNAKKEAIDSANASTDKKLEDYSTTEEMNTAITQKADSITSTVSKTYSTKTETSTAKQEAINSANTSTDNKLKNYSTTTEMNSAITQKANEINLEVGKKVNNEDFTSANITLKLNDGTSEAKIKANKIDINGTVSANGNFKIDTKGNMQANNGKFIGGEIKLTGGTESEPNFYVEGDEFGTALTPEGLYINHNTDTSKHVYVYSDNVGGGIVLGGNASNDITLRAGSSPKITCYGEVQAQSHTYLSLEEKKKNITEFNKKAISIVKNAKLYEFNYKTEDDKKKKHIGFVIGEKYNTPKEVISTDGQGIDGYATNSILWKALQEQQEMIESLQQQIKELKEGK